MKELLVDAFSPNTSSGERLHALLEVVDLSAYRFAAYWAGFDLVEPVPKKGRSPRDIRFRRYRRALDRWLNDEFTIDDEYAREIVGVANRMLAKQGREGFSSDFLVTPSEVRQAGMTEIRGMLREVLERLARIEERL